VSPVTAELGSVLQLPDEVLAGRLLTRIRESGVKFRSPQAFQKCGWGAEPAPRIAKFWSVKDGDVVVSRDQFLWDLREPLLCDDALACCCVLLHRRAQPYPVRWIGGIETAAIPLVAGILLVNQLVGGPPLNGFYIRKARKADGLRRLLEGPRPPRGEPVLLVDDILNKGIAKRSLVAYCTDNDLLPSALLVVVNAERKRGADLFAPVCPVESLFMRRDVLGQHGSDDDARSLQVDSGNGYA
jgi:orotate phosphoribosyltransferase